MQLCRSAMNSSIVKCKNKSAPTKKKKKKNNQWPVNLILAVQLDGQNLDSSRNAMVEFLAQISFNMDQKWPSGREIKDTV